MPADTVAECYTVETAFIDHGQGWCQISVIMALKNTQQSYQNMENSQFSTENV